MPELEGALRELGRELVFPETPALAPAVAARLRTPRPARRRLLLVALAALALALLAALAVPSARTAILELFRLDGATIRRVDRLPPVPPRAALRLGELVSLAQARQRVPFPVLVPQELGEPDGVYLLGEVVSLLYGDEDDVRLLLTEFRGSSTPEFVKKAAAGATSIQRVVVGGEPGYWIEGAPHSVLFLDAGGRLREDRPRLAGNVLLLQRRGLLVRLEADVSRDEAVRIAGSLR